MQQSQFLVVRLKDCIGKPSLHTQLVILLAQFFSPIYDEDDDMGNFVLSINFDEYSLVVQDPLIKKIESKKSENKIWKMFFDGKSSKYGSEVGIVYVSPSKENHTFSFKL
jgi:hypothetical protein